MATREARTTLTGSPSDDPPSIPAPAATVLPEDQQPEDGRQEGEGGERSVDPAVTLDDGRVVVLDRLNGLHLMRLGNLTTKMGMSAQQVGSEVYTYVKTILCIDSIDGLPYQGPENAKAMEWAIDQFSAPDLLELSTRFLELNVGKRLLEQQAVAAEDGDGGAVDPTVTLEDGRVVVLQRLKGAALLHTGKLMTRLGMSPAQIGAEAHAYVKTALSIVAIDGAPCETPAAVKGLENLLVQFSAPDLLELSARFLELNVGKRFLEGDFRG